MASCPHNVDEWAHCPAARLSSPSAIQVGNWGLIECNLREEKQHKQMKTQSIRRLFNIQQIQHLSAYNCQCPSWSCVFSLAKADMTSLLYAAIIHSPSPLFFRLLCPHLFLYLSIITLLSFLVFFCLKFSCFSSSASNLPLLPDSLSPSCSYSLCYVLTHLSFSLSPTSHLCMQVTMVVGEAEQQYRREQKKKKGTQWIVIYRWGKRKK